MNTTPVRRPWRFSEMQSESSWKSYLRMIFLQQTRSTSKQGWFSRSCRETDAPSERCLFRRGLVLAESHRGPSRELAFALGSYAEFGLPYNDPRALEYAERGLQMNKDLFGDRSFEYARGESLLAAVFENYGKYGEKLSSTFGWRWMSPKLGPAEMNR